MECTIARNNRKVFIHFFSGVRAPDLRFDEAKFDFPIFEFPAGFEFSGMMDSGILAFRHLLEWLRQVQPAGRGIRPVRSRHQWAVSIRPRASGVGSI